MTAEDKTYIISILDGMKEECEKMTSGNVSHLKPSIIMGIDEILKIINNE